MLSIKTAVSSRPDDLAHLVDATVASVRSLTRNVQVIGVYPLSQNIFADLAHPVEQRPRNAQVIGSSPIVGYKMLLKTQEFFCFKIKFFMPQLEPITVAHADQREGRVGGSKRSLRPEDLVQSLRQLRTDSRL